MDCIEAFKSSKNDLALICLKTKERGNLHCGIIFKDKKENEKVCLFHFAYHFILSIDDNFIGFSNGIYKIPFEFELTNTFYKEKYNAFFPLMKKVHKQNEKTLNYCTIHNEGNKFFLNGKPHFSGDSFGYTCATFIDSFLNSIGINLIDYGTWTLTDKDYDWRKDVFKQLIGYAEKNEAHKNSICNNIRLEMKKPVTPRIKPQEIVSACDWDDDGSAVFDFCNKNGSIIEEYLNKT